MQTVDHLLCKLDLLTRQKKSYCNSIKKMNNLIYETELSVVLVHLRNPSILMTPKMSKRINSLEKKIMKRQEAEERKQLKREQSEQQKEQVVEQQTEDEEMIIDSDSD